MPTFGFPTLAAAALALSTAFAAQAQSSAVPLDENGFKKELACNKVEVIQQSLLRDNQQPTGIKASTKDWDIEIYEDPVGGRWSAFGVNKNPEFGKTADPASKFNACRLVNGPRSSPYKDQLFYKLHFKQ